MNDTKDVASAVLEMIERKETARTEIGKFRELLPAIQAAHERGIPHKQIHEAIRETGWDLKWKSYETMLYRLRSGKQTKYTNNTTHVPAMPAVVKTPGESVLPVALGSAASAPPEASTTEPELSEALEKQTRRDAKSRHYISDDSSSLLKRLKKD